MSQGPPHGREDPALRGDDDAVWEDLVARIGPLEPPADDGPEAGPGTADPERSNDAAGGAGPVEAHRAPAPMGGDGPRDHALAGPRDGSPAVGDDGDEGDGGLDHRYVPDHVEPLTAAGLAWWAPWLALVGAPVVLALVALTRSSVPGWMVLGCVVVFAGGAVLAVLRLPSAHTGDPGDDGARL